MRSTHAFQAFRLEALMYLTTDIKSIDVDSQALEPTITIALALAAQQNVSGTFLALWCDVKAFVGEKWINLGVRTPDNFYPALSQTVRLTLELSQFKINLIEKLRTKDVSFRVMTQGLCAVSIQNPPTINFQQIDQSIADRKVASSDWVDWLKPWGKDLREVTLSGQTLTKIEAIDEIRGDDPSETVSNLATNYLQLRETLEQLRKGSAIEFVFTELERRTIKEKIASMLSKISKDDTLLITGYLGSPFLDKIIEAVNNGCKIRVVTRSLSGADKETRESTIRIFKSTPDGVRQNDTIHARLFVVEGKEAIISSADIKSDSIDTNYEAGIWTDNPLVMSEVSKFFDRVWKDSKLFTL